MADKKIKVDIVADYDDRGADQALADARKLDGTTAEIEITADTTKLGDQLDDLGSKLGSVGGPLGNLGGSLGALASPGGAIAAIGTGLLVAANRAADLAIEADNLARLTGDSVEAASQLAGVWKSTGAEVTDLQDVLLQMASTLADDADIAEQLGINLADGAGGGERFQQVVDALELIPDATERALLASKLFGEEGVRQVNALTGQYGDLGAAMDKIKPMSAEDAEQARKTKAQIADLSREWNNLVATLGTAVIPVLSAVSGAFVGLGEDSEAVGRGIRDLIDAGARTNHEIVAAFDASERAAADFDVELLAGLTTFDQVHAKVLEVTDSYYAANVIALEWLNTTRQLPGETTGGNFGHAPAAGLAAIAQANADRRDAATAASQARIAGQVTIINPPGTPAATFDQLGSFLTRNSARTEG